MLLTIDINNTNVVFAVMEDGNALFITRLSSDKSRTADEYAVLMELAFRQRDFDIKNVEGAIISSVVPPLTAVIKDAVKIVTNRNPLVIGPGVKTGLNIRLEDPTELGGDFVAAAVAAIAKYPMPCVIVEMGTAIAMGILDKTGSYIGGIICPGPMVSQEALARGAALLSNVSITPTPQVICKSTDACMQSGIVHGSAAMIDGLLERIESELGEPVSVVVTDDWADTIAPYCKREGMITDKELLMRGLWLIYKKNRRG
ncbi:MAG: type III pantothenate kinase [Clostridiales bacterium]|jgi:type III pantothenate kinase|nr:type III pantothenate kinase [Clostridiales bacterium]